MARSQHCCLIEEIRKYYLALVLAFVSMAAAASDGDKQPVVEVSMGGVKYTCPVKGVNVMASGALLVDFTRNSGYP